MTTSTEKYHFVRLRPAVWAKLKKLAASNGQSVTFILEQVVVDYLAAQRANKTASKAA